MVYVRNECCGCSSPGNPCLGDSCRNRKVKHFYCDSCKEEFEPEALFRVEDEDLCTECILNQYKSLKEIEED